MDLFYGDFEWKQSIFLHVLFLKIFLKQMFLFSLSFFFFFGCANDWNAANKLTLDIYSPMVGCQKQNQSKSWRSIPLHFLPNFFASTFH